MIAGSGCRTSLILERLEGIDSVCSALRDLGSRWRLFCGIGFRYFNESQALDRTSSAPALPPAVKRCVSCSAVKPASEFTRHPNSRDLLRHACDDCTALRSGLPRIRAANTPEAKCSACQIVKSASEFNRSRLAASGLQNNCRVCANKKAAERQQQYQQLYAALGRPGLDKKECGKCKHVKPAAEFSQDPRKFGGLYNKCKACHCRDKATRYAGLPIPEERPSKVCRSCHERKAGTDFYSSKQHRDGLLTKCKACCLSQQREQRERSRLSAQKIFGSHEMTGLSSM